MPSAWVRSGNDKYNKDSGVKYSPRNICVSHPNTINYDESSSDLTTDSAEEPEKRVLGI